MSVSGCRITRAANSLGWDDGGGGCRGCVFGFWVLVEGGGGEGGVGGFVGLELCGRSR